MFLIGKSDLGTHSVKGGTFVNELKGVALKCKILFGYEPIY